MVRALDIVRIRFLRGPNIYHPRKTVIKAIIRPHGEYSKLSIGDFQFLVSYVEEKFPEINSLIDGGVKSLVRNREPLYALLPFLSIVLQNAVSWRENVEFAKYFSREEMGLPVVVFEYIYEQVGEEALYMARDIIEELLDNREPPLDRWLKYLKELYFDYAYGPSTRAIVEAAKRRGIPVIRLDPKANLVQLGYGKYRRLIWASTTDKTSIIGTDIAQDKELTKKILDSLGVPVPYGFVVDNEDDAVKAFRRIGTGVVVKPLSGSKGRGITTAITSEDQVREAFRRAKKISDKVVVEEYVKGFDHRILVVNGRVVAVAKRLPAHVVGDGKHTIRELIEIENQNELRGEGHELPLTKIRIDDDTLEMLRKQGYTLDSIPEEGKIVWLKSTANLSTGGVAIDVTDETHPEVEMMAVRIAKALSMDICGIDVITVDISKPLSESNLKVIEVNAAPGLRMHLYPYKGKPRLVGDAIINCLFPEKSKYRIPIIAVTGTNGKTTTVRLIAHILRLAGYSVGYTTTDGIYINGSRIVKGDCTGPWSTQVLLRDPTVDVAVLEVARGGMLREGLAFDECDVGAIINVSEDHLGEYGIWDVEEIARVKGLIYDVVSEDGYGVINADDPLVLKQQHRIRGEKIMVSLYGENNVFREHVKSGGIGVTTMGKMIVIYDDNKMIPIVNYYDIPLTFDGLAEFNLQNALFATAIAYAMKVPVNIIMNGLLSFAPTPSMNPGRCNLMRIKDGYVMVDYAHNPKALNFVGRFINRLARKEGLQEKVAVVSFPGNRPNVLIEKNARELAKFFDRFIVKEDRNKRGRKPGEMAELIRRCLINAGVGESRIITILDEVEAVVYALENKEVDSITFISCEDVDLVLDIVKKWVTFSI